MEWGDCWIVCLLTFMTSSAAAAAAAQTADKHTSA